jgi:hypothetical protein
MNYEEVSVSYFFTNREIIDKQVTAFETSEKFAILRNTIIQKKPQMLWSSVSNEIAKKVPELLDIKLKDILVGAWKKYQQVEQCLEQGTDNPDETFLVPLVKHNIVSEHNPKIEIRIDEVYIGQIDFEILLELELNGIILKIKGSKIEGIKAGSCKCKGSLASEGVVLFQDSTETCYF